MSFTVIISEKGGQERREVFDKNEISIGRVQGNDLLLPKGNVSKRHARIVFRDGRFIVTDLKSTNGSYVNGHRIAQATIVREGDKIYIGDFIIKVEAGTSGAGPLPSPRPSVDSDVPAVLRENEGSQVTPPPRGEGSAVSHIPLEQDPDDMSMTGLPQIGRMPVESRPPGPRGLGSVAGGSIDRRTASTLAGGTHAPPQPPPQPVAPAPPPPVHASRPLPQSMGTSSAMGAPTAAASNAAPSRPSRARDSAPRPPGVGSALAALASRLSDVVDLDEGDSLAPPSDAKRSSVERVLREQARVLQQEGELPSGVAIDDLVRDAAREALGAGPFEALLDDEDVVEIQVSRFDHVVAMREGGHPTTVEPAFSSEAALRRAVGRLVQHRLGTDPYLDVRLASGAHLTAVFPPVAAGGTLVQIRKRRRADFGLEDLVRSGTLSRGMATFLQQCLSAKANVLIAGPLGSGTTTLIGAMASASGVEERTFVVQELDEIVLGQPNGANLVLPDTSALGAKVVRMAASLRPDRLLVGTLAGDIVGQVVEAIGGGLDGVIAALRGPSLRQALARLVPALVAARPGVDPASARQWIGASFDVAVEVARVGGRHRVLRIAEIDADASEIRTRDVFQFVLDPATGDRGEGVFQPTGVIPAVVQELRAHGHRVDESTFKKSR